MTEPLANRPQRRPWWAAPLIGGVGVGLGLFAHQFVAPEARADTPRLAVSGMSSPESSLAERQKMTDTWRDKIENKLDEILKEASETRERLARIEGRLDRK